MPLAKGRQSFGVLGSHYGLSEELPGRHQYCWLSLNLLFELRDRWLVYYSAQTRLLGLKDALVIFLLKLMLKDMLMTVSGPLGVR